MSLLKQSTAYTRAFLMVESSDHITGITGATVTVTLSKAGGSFAAAGGSVAEIGNGWYKVSLNTTDTGTLGDLAFHCTASSADPTDFVDQVIATDLSVAFPANFASLVIDGSGRVDVSKIGGTAQTARDIGASVLISPGTGTGQLDVTSGVIKANLVQILATVLTESVSGYLTAGFKKLLDVATPVFTLASVNQTADVGQTIPELPQAQPPSTATIFTIGMAIYMGLRNKKTVDGSYMKYFNDAGTCIFKTALTDDGTTLTEDKVSTGP